VTGSGAYHRSGGTCSQLPATGGSARPGRRGCARVLVALVAVLLMGLSPAAAGAPLSGEEAADLFSQAKEYFRQANEQAQVDADAARELYRKAALRFERIAREGDIHNGRLYYNIGNAYFRMADVGRAIVNYRRAALFTPNDPNLRQNLDYARTRRIDRIEEKQRTRVLKTLFFWHYDLAPRTRLLLFTLASGLLWTGAAVALFRRRAALRWTVLVCALLTAAMLGSLLVDLVQSSRNVAGVVVASEVVARKGDGETYERAFEEPLHAGTEFTLIESRADWEQVELADGSRCWLPSGCTEMALPLTSES
jgi:tetratricopeptide (TPR) repeat protein